MRGAHRDVWCSKGTPLMEAELFAAERGRPAQTGRALLCAANHASEIQGSSASYKLKDARNRAPVTPPFRRATKGSRVLRRVWGSQEGAREPYGALAPFCPCRWAPTIPPPPGGGIFPPPWARHFPPVNTGISGRRRQPVPPCRGNGTPAARRRLLPKTPRPVRAAHKFPEYFSTFHVCN